jgi:deoxyribodipyrimidine photo-lyase
VGARLGELSTLCWHDNTAAIVAALQSARSVRGVDDLHLDAGLSALLNSEPPRQLFAKVERPCSSFSKWWKLANHTV